MRKKRKRRKLRKWLKILLLLLLLFIISIIIYKLIPKKISSNKKVIQKEKIIEKLNTKIEDENIDKNFLEWINTTYGNKSLVKLNKLLDNNEYSADLWHEVTNNSYIVLQDLYNKKYEDMDNVKIIKGNNTSTLSFVGDVSLADNWYIMPKYDERNKGVYGILSEDTVKVMTESTLMIANNEFTVSDRGEKMPGKYYTFRASPKRLKIYEEMGVDLVTLANNHVYDFGKTAFYDMIDSLNEYKIPYIGAGKNIEEAKKPFYFIVNGYKISFVNATRAEKLILTPEATEDEGGVFRCYDPTNFINVIKQEKEVSDYVIALIHYGKEDSHSLEDVQVESSKQYIDAGADVIVGSHAHVLQGIEFYKEKPIIYNLGDFIFNDETKDTGIFQIKLNNNGNMEYYFIPALEQDEYTKLLDGEEKQRVINNMNSWSINAQIDSNGKIEEN